MLWEEIVLPRGTREVLTIEMIFEPVVKERRSAGGESGEEYFRQRKHCETLADFQSFLGW